MKRPGFIEWQAPLSAADFMTVMAPRFSLSECIRRLSGRFCADAIRDAYAAAMLERESRIVLPAVFIEAPAKRRFVDCRPEAIEAALAYLRTSQPQRIAAR